MNNAARIDDWESLHGLLSPAHKRAISLFRDEQFLHERMEETSEMVGIRRRDKIRLEAYYKWAGEEIAWLIMTHPDHDIWKTMRAFEHEMANLIERHGLEETWDGEPFEVALDLVQFGMTLLTGN